MNDHPVCCEKNLSIADVKIRIRSDCHVESTVKDKPFSVASCDPNDMWCVYIQKVFELPPINGKVIYSRQEYDIRFDASNGMTRWFRNILQDGKYYSAVRYQVERKCVYVSYLAGYESFFSEVNKCLFHAGFERLMLQAERLILHASCVQTAYGGVLFTGPSGIGKSTQADLWCRYRDAELINGDRTVLERRFGAWYGWGSPYAGSSKCYRAASCNIKAIAVLHQSEKCSISTLSQADAFRAIFSEITANVWNREYMEIAVGMVQKLVSEIPIFSLTCTPTEEAVSAFERVLRCCNG